MTALYTFVPDPGKAILDGRVGAGFGSFWVRRTPIVNNRGGLLPMHCGD